MQLMFPSPQRFFPCSLNLCLMLWIAWTSAWLVEPGAQNVVRRDMGRIVLFTTGPQGTGVEEVG